MNQTQLIKSRLDNNQIQYVSDQLLCGIDGGGTTTKVVVCNIEGQVVYSFQTGTINHYGTGINIVKTNFADIASKLTSRFDCLPGIIYTGNSALDGLAGESLVNQLTQGVFRPSKVIFHSDSYVALLGFTLGNPGVMLIAGTGSMACGIDADGVWHTVGGWGQVLGDEGSGYHIAMKGIKAALRAYDGIREPTQLTGKVMRFFDLKMMPELIDKIYNPPVEKSVIAAFAQEVENTAAEGDKTAMEILEDEAIWLYKIALSITSKCKTTKIGYNGSVLNNNQFIRTKLSTKLAEHAISLEAPKLTPELGALIGAFREQGIAVTDSIIDNLLKHIQE